MGVIVTLFKSIVYGLLAVVVFSVGITFWDLFVTDPCNSYNRALSAEQRIEQGCKQ